MSIAKYIFLPYLRHGLSSVIDQGTDLPSNITLNESRVKLKFQLKLNEIDDLPQEKDVYIFGPGDVIGFDKSIIIRTDPKPKVYDFEPNYFPMVEFSEGGFPWWFTPERAKDNKLKPWISLIVLKDKGENASEDQDQIKESEAEFEDHQFDGGTTRPYITVLKQQKSLPNLENAWANAHVQITTDKDSLSKSEIQSIRENHPERIVSRIFCMRKLEPGRKYHAFLVPTYKTGLLAGLGDEISEDTKINDLAWDVTQTTDIDLPYYYRWEFRTGHRGDFEHLVRLLNPEPLDNRVGKRYVDCSDPGIGLPNLGIDIDGLPETFKNHPGADILDLPGALQHLDHENVPLNEGTNVFKEKLISLINLTEPDPENGQSFSRVVPPIYGKWHAGIRKITDNLTGWVKQLNINPRNRIVAGFGTKIVQDNQESIMHEAWRQLGDIDIANQRIREAQMVKSTNIKTLENKLSSLNSNELILLASSLHSKILHKDQNVDVQGTIRNYIGSSKIPSNAFDPAFRKIIRPRGPVRKKQINVEPGKYDHWLERMNKGELKGAGEAPKLDGAKTIGDVSEEQRPAWATGWFWKVIKILPWILLGILFILLVLILILYFTGVSLNQSHPLVIAAESVLLLFLLFKLRITLKGTIADKIKEENITPEVVASSKPISELQDGEDFQLFAGIVQSFLNYKDPQSPEPVSANLNNVKSDLIEAIQPEKALSKRLSTMVRFNGEDLRNDPFEEIMAHPVFDRPMYEPLKKLSSDYLLPGLEFVKQNTISLLKTNNEFVESVMGATNSEAVNEFRYREFPTDMKATPFRHFWDVSEVYMSAIQQNELETLVNEKFEEKINELEGDEKIAFIELKIEEEWNNRLTDIKPMHLWKNNMLGCNRVVQIPDGNIVLLIRGDLLKKYPNTLIYVVKAIKSEEETILRIPDFTQVEAEPPGELLNEEKPTMQLPIFKGTLEPDVTFIGFELTEKEARGTKTDFDNLGWFFVIEQRISESRFGLDSGLEGVEVPGLDTDANWTWEDLNWRHFEDLLSPSDYLKGNFNSSGERIKVTRIDSESNEDEELEPDGVAWNAADDESWTSHSGNIAWITHQKPVRIAIHANDMMYKEE